MANEKPTAVVEPPKPWPIPARIITPEEMQKHIDNDVEYLKYLQSKQPTK